MYVLVVQRSCSSAPGCPVRCGWPMRPGRQGSGLRGRSSVGTESLDGGLAWLRYRMVDGRPRTAPPSYEPGTDGGLLRRRGAAAGGPLLPSRDCEARGMSHQTPAPSSRASVVASARERARPARPGSARPVRRLQEAQHVGGEQVGGGVHCGVSLARHDRDAAVRQSPPQRLAGRLERFAAVAALEI